MTLEDGVFAPLNSFLLACNGDLILGEAERRHIDAHAVLLHHGLDLLIVGAADEWVVLLWDLQFLIGLLALWMNGQLGSGCREQVFYYLIRENETGKQVCVFLCLKYYVSLVDVCVRVW